jgi:uncharacterized membrane protein YqjE
MSHSNEPLFEPLREGLSRLGVDLYDLARTRLLLARCEATAAIRSLRGLVVVLAIAAVLVLTALPVLVVALADALHHTLGMSRWGWLCLFGGGLLSGGVAAGWAKYRRFRQEFVGLEETLEEFHEDVAWLREWIAGLESDSDADG